MPKSSASSKKITKEQAEVLETIKRLHAACIGSLANFCKVFMTDEECANFVVPTRGYRVLGEIPQFQAELFRDLDHIKSLKRLCLSSPRGFAKSASCSIFFPLHAALYKHFNEILIVSSSEDIAINFMRNIRTNLESNKRVMCYFGKQESSKWTETHMILNNGVNIRCCGVGAQIRGRRPDLIILDDIESDESVLSEDLRRKLKDWLFKAAINSLAVDGCMVFVGTLISPLAILYDFVNAPPEGWKAIFNQAYRGGIEEPGHELWPELWPHERLQARKKEIGSVAFSSEFMNKPIPSEGIRFNPEHIQYYEDKDLAGRAMGEYITIDPAFSQDSSADYGVILQCLHDTEDNLYVKTFFRERTTARTLIDRFKSIYKANQRRIKGVGIGMNGPQKAFYEQLVEECNRERLYPMFTELKGMIKTGTGTKRRKEDRITYAIQPRLEARKIYFKREHQALIDELLIFPNGKHDDLIDALAYQFEVIEPYIDYQIMDESSFSFDQDPEPDVIPCGVTGYGEVA